MYQRFTNRLTWEEIVRLYRLTIHAPPHNLPPGYNICPTDPVDGVTELNGNLDFVRIRGGIVPSWWPKPLKDLKAATFNACAETVAEKPFFRDAFRRTRCLIPASGYYEWEELRPASSLGTSPARWRADDVCRAMGRMEGQDDGRGAEVLHDAHHRAERFRC